MKIHNYSNDYVMAEKFKNGDVNNAKNQTRDDRRMPGAEVLPEVDNQEAEEGETKKTPRQRKKKQN